MSISDAVTPRTRISSRALSRVASVVANPGIVKFILAASPVDGADLRARLAEAYPHASDGDLRSAASLARRQIRSADAELKQKASDYPEHAELIERTRARHAALLAALRGL